MIEQNTDKRQLLKRAIDGNAYTTSDGNADNVNPEIWEDRVRDFQRELLVVTELAESFDFRGPGSNLTVTIDETPSEASNLTETSDVGISSHSTRQVKFDPDEYGDAYQINRKEAVRSFYNIAERMTTKLAHKTALKKDTLGANTVYNNANVEVFAGSGNSAQGDLSAGDTLDLATIIEARKKINQNKYNPDVMVIGWNQEAQALNLDGLQRAADFGGTEAIRRGVVGRLFGIEIVAADSVQIDSAAAGDSTDVEKAMLLGQTRTGERALGYAIKRDLMIEREYHALGRYWDIVAHEEYDFKALHPDGMAVVHTTVA